MLRDQRRRQKAVVAGFGNPHRIESSLLSSASRSRNIAQIASRETSIELHSFVLPTRESSMSGRIVTKAALNWKEPEWSPLLDYSLPKPTMGFGLPRLPGCESQRLD